MSKWNAIPEKGNPKRYGLYLVTIDDCNQNCIRHDLYWFTKDGWRTLDGWGEEFDVIAWLKIPKVYQSELDE
jgi:hypothetical protein